MSLETCKLCNQDCTPWVHVNGHICQDCALPISKWISVKDRLPENNNWKVYAVLVNHPNLRKHQIAWFQFSDKTFRLENEPNTPIKVTHWIPVPQG